MPKLMGEVNGVKIFHGLPGEPEPTQGFRIGKSGIMPSTNGLLLVPRGTIPGQPPVRKPKIVLASEEEQERRAKICGGCADYVPTTEICKKCGCGLKYKTLDKAAKCPADKW